MALKLLIVDDEELIRDGIARKIESMFPHFQIVGKAADADEAQQMADDFHPDIIITDIRMPEVDGLQLIERVLKKHRDTRFILISGYQDFEYARRGIELGVENYLLKPIENEKLRATLQKLEEKINETTLSRSHLNVLKDRVRDDLDYLKTKYLNDIINHTGDFDVGYIVKNLDRLEIRFTHSHYTIITVAIETFENIPGFDATRDVPLIKYAVRNITEEIFSGLGSAFAFENLKKDKWISVIINHDNCRDQKIINFAKCVLESLETCLSLVSTIGAGRSFDNIDFLYNSYLESCTAVLQSLILGKSNVIHIASVPASNLVTYFIPENEKLLLLSYINSRNQDKAFEIIDDIFSNVISLNLSYANTKALYIDIAIMLGKTVKEAGGSWENIFRKDILSEDFLSGFTTLDQLKDWIKDCISSICVYLSDLRKSDGRKAIKEIKEYIDNYYYSDVNFNELSVKYFINPSYLSQLFKNEVSENFSEYLTRVRMEKARELLGNSELKTYEVAEMVGYSDPRYFAKVFAKHAGMTPGKYREQVNG